MTMTQEAPARDAPSALTPVQEFRQLVELVTLLGPRQTSIFALRSARHRDCQILIAYVDEAVAVQYQELVSDYATIGVYAAGDDETEVAGPNGTVTVTVPKMFRRQRALPDLALGLLGITFDQIRHRFMMAALGLQHGRIGLVLVSGDDDLYTVNNTLDRQLFGDLDDEAIDGMPHVWMPQAMDPVTAVMWITAILAYLAQWGKRVTAS